MRDTRMGKIERLVRAVDPHLDRYEPAFQRVAVAFVAALYTGSDVRSLVRFTGYLEKTVTDVRTRMRASGLWEKGVVHDEDLWSGKELKPSGLWLTGEVAKGRLIARRRADGVWVYSDPILFGQWQGRLPFPDQPGHSGTPSGSCQRRRRSRVTASTASD